jgi:hypothetical protein
VLFLLLECFVFEKNIFSKNRTQQLSNIYLAKEFNRDLQLSNITQSRNLVQHMLILSIKTVEQTIIRAGIKLDKC